MEAHASLVAAPEDTEQILAMIRIWRMYGMQNSWGEEPGLTVKNRNRKKKCRYSSVLKKILRKKVVGYLKASPKWIKSIQP